MEQTIAKKFGLTEGQEVDVTYTSGPHNGETFSGALSVDVVEGEPVYLEGHEDVTSNVKEIVHDGNNQFFLTLSSGSTCVLAKKTSSFKSSSSEKATVVI